MKANSRIAFMNEILKRINLKFLVSPGADSWKIRFSTSNAPTNNACEEPPVILLRVDHERTPGVTL